MSAGELDAILADRWLGEYQLTLSNHEGIRIVDEPIEKNFSRIAVRKGNDELLNSINALP